MLETERLIFKLLEEKSLPAYLDDFINLDSDADVRFHFPSGTLTKEECLKRLNHFISCYHDHGTPCYVLLDKNDNFVGRCGFSLLPNGELEVGYVLAKPAWGKGYATECLSALLNWGKQNLAYPTVIGYAPIEHVASHHVMEKCGMQYYETKNDATYNVSCKFYRYLLHAEK